MNYSVAELKAAARSAAVSRGHESITPAHLVAAMLSLDEQSARTVLGNNDIERAQNLLAGLPKVYGRSPEPDPDVETILSELPQSGWDELVAGRITKWLQGARERGPDQSVPSGSTAPRQDQADGTPADGGGPPPKASDSADAVQQGFQLPQRFEGIASVVLPDPDLLPRPDIVVGLLGRLRTMYRSLPVLVAAPGSGRSTVGTLIATQLAADPDSMPVVRLRGVSARLESDKAHSLLSWCRGRAVVVLDDLDVMLGLGGRAVDMHTLAFLRATMEDPEHRIVGVIEPQYREVLKTLDREFADEIDFVVMPGIDSAQMPTVVDHITGRLAKYHAVSFDHSAVAQMLAAMMRDGEPPTPGEVARQLDLAAGSVKVGGRSGVTADDLPIKEDRSVPTSPVELKKQLGQDVFGQDEAIDRVAQVVAMTRAQLDERAERPDGVFLFAGPTGTGKTELARSLARVLHGSRDALIRLDMSEFYGEHTIANLIGSPPGYVGSDSPSGWLTTRVRERPDSVLLLDEVEKAHPLVWNAFLQVFDAGRMTDAANGEVDFSRVTIIATTNLGSRAFLAKDSIGFVSAADEDSSAQESQVLDTIKNAMSPELVNRFDAIVVFHPLTAEAVHQICRHAVDRLRDRMSGRGWQLDVDEGVVAHLAETGYSRDFGARELQRTIDRSLLEPLMVLPPGDYRARMVGGAVEIGAASD